MVDKTHYRKVFKSDHLGVADLEDYIEEGSSLIYTITHVNQEYGTKVAGKKIDANIAYFKEQIKPLVINAGNSKILKGFAGNSPFVEDWKNITVQLYIDPTAKLKGEIVGGVRISPERPQIKPSLTPADTDRWANARLALQRCGNIDKILARATMTPEHQSQLVNEAEENVS